MRENKKYKFTFCGIIGCGLSVVSLVFACLSFAFLYLCVVSLTLSIAGIIISSIGVHYSKKNLKEGKDISNFGMSLNVILLITSLILFVYFLIAVI